MLKKIIMCSFILLFGSVSSGWGMDVEIKVNDDETKVEEKTYKNPVSEFCDYLDNEILNSDNLDLNKIDKVNIDKFSEKLGGKGSLLDAVTSYISACEAIGIPRNIIDYSEFIKNVYSLN